MADCILETEKMLVLQAQLGDWDNLTHLLVCKKTNKAVIIDPFFSDYWSNLCKENTGPILNLFKMLIAINFNNNFYNAVNTDF